VDKVERLKSILLENLTSLEPDSFGWHPVSPPRFELQARDYLGFAEEELDKANTAGLVNCVHHLKRAMDCQVDMYLDFLDLYEFVRRRNLKFEKKMDFIAAIGIYNARSLARLNSIRNRMEHDYEIPEIQDMQVYFDLVAAFISVLELATMIPRDVHMAGKTEQGISGLELVYDRDSLSIKVKWQKEDHEELLTVSAYDDITGFGYYLKTIYVLGRMFNGAVDHRQALSQIQM
jgi:hypothetical protein